MVKAILEYWEKNYFNNNRYVLEISIWSVDDSRYPGGVKYSLIFLDTRTKKKILLDNHHPKGPHVHFGDKELPYRYKNEKKLVQDFKSFVYQHFGVKI